MRDDAFKEEPSAIAAELARDRAALAGSVNALRSSFTPETLLQEVAAFAQARVGSVTQAVDSAVRANPLAAAMAAAGVAWLVFGRKSKPDTYADTIQNALRRWEDDGGTMHAEDQVWIAETDRLRDSARAALAKIDHAARLNSGAAADTAHDRATVIADLAAQTRIAMAHGLESMSEAARSQIIAARERAYQAHLALTRKSSSLIEDHPFVAGTVALAAGVALASALPVTETEIRVLGPERDHLFSEAKYLLAAAQTGLADQIRAA